MSAKINQNYVASNLGNDVWYFENIYSDLPKILNNLDNVSWEPWNRYGPGALPLGRAASINSNHSILGDDLSISFLVFKEYCNRVSLPVEEYEIFNSVHLRRWDAPNNGMPPHSDFTYKNENQDKIIPAFTISYYLTEDYDGGLIEFPEIGVSLKPSAGSVIVFPSSTIHSVSDLESGNRVNAQEYVFNKGVFNDN